MAPPGRRRNFSEIFVSLAFFILLTATPTWAASAVLGIDIGTKSIKAALVKPGIPLEIVLTKDSRRRQDAAIAFKTHSHDATGSHLFPERVYGGDALALAARFPGDVYANLKPLLGLSSLSELAAQQYQQRYPALKLVSNIKDGKLGFENKGFGTDDHYFSIEELLAMELKVIKENAEDMSGKGHVIRDVVITVPAFYTADERRALELAANLAGLKVMGLISDGLAVGLNFATSRTFPKVEKGEKPEYHLVYDMGSGSTTATLLRFQEKIVKDVGRFNKTIQEVAVLSTAWDRVLGGDTLTDLIVNDIVDKFVESKNGQKLGLEATALKTHGKSMAKLFKAAENTRQVLSANTITSASITGLYQEDIDFSYKLSRADFETLAGEFALRVSKPIEDVLLHSELEIKDLTSIILHGGLVRTPFVQKSLEALVKDPSKLRSNVNADESAVFGAAFKAAGLSPSFRVKEIRSIEAGNFFTNLKWTADGKDRQQQIFIPSSQVGVVKQVPFKNQEDFAITLEQSLLHPVSAEAALQPISNIKITNLTASVAELVKTHGCQQEAIKTTFSLRLNPEDSLPEVVEGSVSCEVDATDKKGGVVDDVKGFFGFGGKKDQKALTDDDDAETKTSKKKSKTSSSSSNADSTATPGSDNKTEKSSEKLTIKKKTLKIPLSLEKEFKGLPEPSTEQLNKMKDGLVAYEKSDQGRRERDDLFNVLESFTYKTRDLISNQNFIDVSTLTQRDAIDSLLSTTSEWLYPEGATAAIDIVKEKLKGLKDLVDPIQSRVQETASRPKSLKTLQDALTSSDRLIKVIKDQIAKASASASSASEAAASSVAEALESALPEGTDSLKDEDDLDSESSSSSSTTPTPTPLPKPDYSEMDLLSVTSIYDSIKSWLDEKLPLQDALSTHDDPILLTADLQSRSAQLNKLTQEILVKRANARAPPRPKSSSKPKSTKSKTKSDSSSSATAAEPVESSAETSVETPVELPVESMVSEGEAAPSHGEL